MRPLSCSLRALFICLMFYGIAAAQVTGGGGPLPFTCAVNTATPTLRAESFTEEIGDIVVTCTGGAMLAPGQPIPAVDITVFLPTQITSRLLNGNASDALLLIDEPNSGLSALVPGFGPAEPFTLCNTPLTGCAAWAQQAAGSDNQTYEVAVNGPTASPEPANAAPNVYQGVVSGNYVTFYGVPVLPPAANATRVLRITNIRMNANAVGGVNSSVPVQVGIVASNWLALSLSNATPVIGFVQTSLSTSAANSAELARCNVQTLQQVNVFSFSELFGSAFKTRVDPSVPGQTSGQSGALIQNRPGSGYNSEANLTMAISGEAPAGLADFGTRLKAVFRSILPGVRLFVSLTNVTVDGTTGLVTGQVASPASTSITSFAELMTNETGPFTVATPAPQTAPNGVNVVEITPLSGTTTATAVWEVVNTDPHSIDTLRFGVYVSYTAGPIAGGMGTVTLGYAPTGTMTTASASAPIPRFLDTSISLPAVDIASCQNTSLTLTASPNPAVYGQPVTLTASASTGATGGVIFDEYPSTQMSNGAIALSNGKVQFTTTSVPTGSRTLFAIYGGDANFLPATSNQISLTVQKAATSIVITSGVGQQPITATVTVNAPGTATPTGTVQFWHGSTYFGTVALPQGQTNVSLIGVVVPGLTATYSGDGNFIGSVSAALSTPEFTCTSAAYSTRALRTEGLAEEIGDLLVTCKYGNALPPGQPIPQVNITVTLPVPITSRLLSDRVSEALLMIDEPNSSLPNLGVYNPVPGFGGDEPFTLCSTPLTGCAAWEQQTVGTDTQTSEVAVNGPNAPPLAANAAPNANRGVVNGNSVTFYGVPILPPAANGQRVLRITNIRVDASQIDPIKNGVAASIVPSNSSALPITVGYTPMPGFGITSLASTAAIPAQLTACNAQNLRQATVLNYGELFSSVFKTRVDLTVQGQPSGQSAALVQNNPWIFYNSESTFTYSITGEKPEGLADFGTRFKAVFKNVPAGVRLFVSLTNVTVDGTTGLVTGQASSSSQSFAQLVTSETGPFAVATPFSQMAPNQVSVVEITPATGSTTATAVWEVVTTNPNALPNALETFKFAVYVSYAPSPSVAGTATVNLGYGPTSTSPTIPRFLDTSILLPALSIGSCQVTSSLTLTASPNPALYGQPVTLTASAPTGATGGVIFKQTPSTQIGNGAMALSNNKAQFTSGSFPVGTTSLLATYGGDINFLSATSNQVALTVQKAATTIAITSQQGRQPVTATVTVTAPGSGALTGTVQFFNGSNFVGSVLLPQGQTSVSLNALTLPGMTAVYSGDSNFTGSTSSPVGAPMPRNLMLSAGPNPSILGQTVTFTLSAANTASGSTAQFYDGSTLLGSATMNNGQATFSTSALATGSHAMVASYMGDSASFG